ncbi:MAG: hypothetical protein ACK5IJ_12415 [Mangrovibacterium sp.]
MKIKTLLISTLIMLIANLNVLAESATEPATKKESGSFKFSMGFGSAKDWNYEGTGFIYTVGYQRTIWNEKLSINPNFSVGTYSAQSIEDVPKAYFSSKTIDVIFYYDFLQVDKGALVFGAGLMSNHLNGFSANESGKYEGQFHYGIYLGGGFKFKPLNDRLTLSVMPINIRFGNDYFSEFNASIVLNVKL